MTYLLWTFLLVSVALLAPGWPYLVAWILYWVAKLALMVCGVLTMLVTLLVGVPTYWCLLLLVSRRAAFAFEYGAGVWVDWLGWPLDAWPTDLELCP